MSDLVIALHGTRSREGTRTAERLRLAVAERLPGVEVATGFVDIHEVRLAEVVAESIGVHPALVELIVSRCREALVPVG